MPYRLLADAVVFVHFGFILFVAAGAVLAWRWPRLVWAHLPALAWSVGTLAIGFPCPLTALEKALRRWGEAEEYTGGFVDRYIEDVVYPDEYSLFLRTLALLLIVAGYYGLRRSRRRAGHPPRLLVAAGARSEGRYRRARPNRAIRLASATTMVTAAPPRIGKS